MPNLNFIYDMGPRGLATLCLAPAGAWRKEIEEKWENKTCTDMADRILFKVSFVSGIGSRAGFVILERRDFNVQTLTLIYGPYEGTTSCSDISQALMIKSNDPCISRGFLSCSLIALHKKFDLPAPLPS